MYRIAVCILCLLALVTFGYAQAPDSLWSSAIGDSSTEYCFAATQTFEGGYVLAGRVYDYDLAASFYWLAKTDSTGDSLWSRRYFGIGLGQFNSVIQTPDSGFILTGDINGIGAGGYDVWLLKTNKNGDSLWSKTYGGTSNDHGYEVEALPSGGYGIVGSTASFGSGSEDFWIIIVNAAGDSITSRTYGSAIGDYCVAFERASDGGFVLAGYSSAFGSGSNDMWLVKFDILGEFEWMHSYGGSGIDQCRAICKTNDGGYALAGWTASFGVEGSTDFWLVKTNANGDSLWSRTYGGTGTERCYTITPTMDGGFALSGQTDSFGSGSYDYWLVKTDANGDSLWSVTLGGTDEEDCRTVMQTNDGSYALAGHTFSFGSGNADFWLARLGNTRPTITSITDVGNDQGRRVRIRWDAAYWDILNSDVPITAYSIYRRIDLYRTADPVRQPAHSLDWPPGDWEYILTVPARTEETYATIVPTLADSTSEGIYWSAYFVSAESTNPGIFFDSPVDSGYSVDNISPASTLITAGLQIVGDNIVLRWEEVETGVNGQPEHNGIWYRVYGSTDPQFTPNAGALLTTTQNLSYSQPITEDQFYFQVLVSDDY